MPVVSSRVLAERHAVLSKIFKLYSSGESEIARSEVLRMSKIRRAGDGIGRGTNNSQWDAEANEEAVNSLPASIHHQVRYPLLTMILPLTGHDPPSNWP